MITLSTDNVILWNCLWMIWIAFDGFWIPVAYSELHWTHLPFSELGTFGNGVAPLLNHLTWVYTTYFKIEFIFFDPLCIILLFRTWWRNVFTMIYEYLYIWQQRINIELHRSVARTARSGCVVYTSGVRKGKENYIIRGDW